MAVAPVLFGYSCQKIMSVLPLTPTLDQRVAVQAASMLIQFRFSINGVIALH
jgi:hypothetical protein